MANGSEEPQTPEAWSELCTKVKDLVPEEAVGAETWYLIIAAILLCSPSPATLGDLYTHLTSPSPENTTRFSAPNNQPLLSERLRDVLLKLIPLIGAPPVIVGVGALATAESRASIAAAARFGSGGAEEEKDKEKAEDDGKEEETKKSKASEDPEAKVKTDVRSRSEASVLSAKWEDYDMKTIESRGQKTINTIYGPTLLPEIFAGFGSHKKDVVHVEVAHVYGLYLSDHSVLSAIESEVVVFVAILCTGLRGPALWHVRGLGRLLGARGEDAENSVKDVIRGVKMAAMAVVEFCGKGMEERVKVSEWPNVGDVGRELGGFGDDAFGEEEEEEHKRKAEEKDVGEGIGVAEKTGDTKYDHREGEEEREWAKGIRAEKAEETHD